MAQANAGQLGVVVPIQTIRERAAKPQVTSPNREGMLSQGRRLLAVVPDHLLEAIVQLLQQVEMEQRRMRGEE